MNYIILDFNGIKSLWTLQMKIFPACGFLCGQQKDKEVCRHAKQSKKLEKPFFHKYRFL